MIGPQLEYPPAIGSYGLYGEIAPELAPLWADVLEQFDPTTFEYQAWLLHTALVSLSPAAAVVGTPNWISRDEIRAHYLEALRSHLSTLLGHPVTLTVVIDKHMNAIQERRAMGRAA